MKTPIRTHEGRLALVTGAGQGSAKQSHWHWRNEAHGSLNMSAHGAGVSE